MQITDINTAKTLKNLRKKHDLSQSQVAQHCNIETNAYGHYEAGRAKPTLETLIALCDLYGISTIDELLGLAPLKEKRQCALVEAYQRAEPEIRRIVDFALNLKC
jgi:transcriptional regulator with XRE-family HTH domain